MIAVGGVTVLVCSLLTLVWWFFVVGCLVLLAWFLDSWVYNSCVCAFGGVCG